MRHLLCTCSECVSGREKLVLGGSSSDKERDESGRLPSSLQRREMIISRKWLCRVSEDVQWGLARVFPSLQMRKIEQNNKAIDMQTGSLKADASENDKFWQYRVLLKMCNYRDSDVSWWQRTFANHCPTYKLCEWRSYFSCPFFAIKGRIMILL